MTGGAQDRIELLKLVQGVVNRMAANSAQMKTWVVSLVAAVFVFSGLADKPHWLIGAGGCIPIIALWAMDAKYLHLEKCYRALYEAVVAGKAVTAFDLDCRPFAASVDSLWRIAVSWSVSLFCGALLILTLGPFSVLVCAGT